MMGGLNALPLSGNVASPAIPRRVSFVVRGAGLATSAHAADADKAVDAIKTASPIKHVIIIVGENRSFDHLFATYVPRSNDERVRNLLSESIVNAGGSPGRNLARLINSRSWLPPNGGQYFISTDKNQRGFTICSPLLTWTNANSLAAGVLSLPCGEAGLIGQASVYRVIR
jgi:phospholipase C